ncbi:MAG: T9SS type A sorting domain-containing protein [Chitinophagaceae bacterium]|nr:MAG: T9SS type A sorting domain-containing protein [Chitinophagaceae bacterium]
MKTVPAIVAFLLACITTTTTNATNYINSLSSTAYSLLSGDTLRIVGNSYNGVLNSFQSGSVIIVSAGATFSPGNMNTPSGKIINYGVCQFNNLGTSGNFEFVNYNVATFSSHLNLYDGAKQSLTNNIGGTITIAGNLSINNAVLNNYSTMTVGGDLNMYRTNSLVNNTGNLTIGKDLNISGGLLDNQNLISTRNLNTWGGVVKNQGELSPAGDMVFSAGSNYSNECLMITKKGFTNYGNFTNNGLLWVGTSGSPNDHFLNSGTFTNSTDAVVKTVKLTNYSTIVGGGSYYITGDSYNSGIVGKSGTTTDLIRVYDLTRANSSRIFDTQWGTVNDNVVFSPFAQPDTNEVNYAGCSSLFRANIGSTLPVEWKSFDVKLVQNQAAITWSAEYEANVKFEVEKSTDRTNFKSITTASSNTTKSYAHTDANVEKNTVVYYRIKATSLNGAVKYTDTKSLKIAGTASALSVYPNPTKDVATIQYKSDVAEALTIRISNASGLQVALKNVTALKGLNAFNLTETAQLNAGVYFAELINVNSVVASVRIIKN